MKLVKTPRSPAYALADLLLTALAWSVFCYLLATGIHPIVQGALHGPAGAMVSRLLPDIHTLVVYTCVALGIDLLLLAWARYNTLRFGGLDRRKARPALPAATLAASFGISLDLLEALHASQDLRIHHTDEGRISQIDFTPMRHPAAGNVLRIVR
jgi:biofilm PGA synthesis protein PgaD